MSGAVAEACPEWEVNDWVVVKYRGTMYPGQVIDIVETGFRVDCMHESIPETIAPYIVLVKFLLESTT